MYNIDMRELATKAFPVFLDYLYDAPELGMTTDLE